jgi:hypothetical protein
MSVVVGCFSDLPAVGLFLACLGLIMGMWGLFGKHLKVTVIGIILCGLAITISGYRVWLPSIPSSSSIEAM